MADTPQYHNPETRADWLRQAQVKLAQAALFLQCADEETRALAAITLSREVQQIRKAARP